jgi:hypothetical protein
LTIQFISSVIIFFSQFFLSSDQPVNGSWGFGAEELGGRKKAAAELFAGAVGLRRY